MALVDNQAQQATGRFNQASRKGCQPARARASADTALADVQEEFTEQYGSYSIVDYGSMQS